MIKPIHQEHGFGCGVACVAFALDLSYQEALRLFKKAENAWMKGYMCKDLVEALASGGRNYKHFWYQKRHEHHLGQDGVIVYTKKSSKYPAGHYLIKTKKGWMNPWSNFPVIYPHEAKFEEKLSDDVGYIIVPEEYLEK